MAESSPLTKEIFSDPSDEEILTQLAQFAKFKQRSHQTHHNIHIPELNFRLNLGLDNPGASTRDEGSTETQDPFAPVPDLSNKSPIEVVYLGNSMLERLKTTGKDTNLGKLRLAFNAGCGGDKTENVAYRLEQGLYSLLKTAQAKQQEEQQQERNCNIKLWILASGTNNLHPKRPFRTPDVESYKALVKACLRIAPRSKVLACDMFFRKDVAEEIVEKGNEMLMRVVEDLNREMKEENRSDRVDENIGEDKVVWMEARKLIGRDMFVDHVHLNEEGYAVWDGVLWPWVEKVLGF